MPVLSSVDSLPSVASAAGPFGGDGPRERAAELGLPALADEDLLALVLGTGGGGESVRLVATRLLDDSGGLLGLLRRGTGGLSAARGLGQVKALRILAGLELGRRAHVRELMPRGTETGQRFADFEQVAAWARPRLAALEHEELWLLAVDGRQGARATRKIAAGGIHGLHVSARDVLRAALREAASAFVVVHNHPSGDPLPSAADLDFTARLARAGHAVGVPLLDHVIVAREGATSLLAQGMVPDALEEADGPDDGDDADES
jgi:DNA repair protein RadC